MWFQLTYGSQNIFCQFVHILPYLCHSYQFRKKIVWKNTQIKSLSKFETDNASQFEISVRKRAENLRLICSTLCKTFEAEISSWNYWAVHCQNLVTFWHAFIKFVYDNWQNHLAICIFSSKLTHIWRMEISFKMMFWGIEFLFTKLDYHTLLCSTFKLEREVLGRK